MCIYFILRPGNHQTMSSYTLIYKTLELKETTLSSHCSWITPSHRYSFFCRRNTIRCNTKLCVSLRPQLVKMDAIPCSDVQARCSLWPTYTEGSSQSKISTLWKKVTPTVDMIKTGAGLKAKRSLELNQRQCLEAFVVLETARMILRSHLIVSKSYLADVRIHEIPLCVMFC